MNIKFILFPARPLNMLDSYENRFGYALAFGATTSHCLNVLIGSVQFVLGSKWGHVIASSPSYVSSKLKTNKILPSAVIFCSIHYLTKVL